MSHADVSAAGAPAQGAQKLRVGVLVAEPFVIQSGDHYNGYSIDYWEKVAEVLGVAYKYVPLTTVNEAVSALNNHSVGVVIGAIGMTADREHNFDLTHAYLNDDLLALAALLLANPEASSDAPFFIEEVTDAQAQHVKDPKGRVDAHYEQQ